MEIMATSMMGHLDNGSVTDINTLILRIFKCFGRSTTTRIFCKKEKP